MSYFGPYFGVSGGSVAPAPDGPGTQPARLAVGYCTDEDVALVAGDDFGALASRALKRAEASDGVFPAGLSWELRSESVDFAAQGVGANSVVLLYAPAANFGRVGTGEALAVNSASGGSAYLRRLGEAPGVGQPPGPPAGLAGVRFACFTFAPQIDRASFQANRHCGIDPAQAGRAPADLTDLRELKDWTVLTVLRWAYAAQPKTEGSDFSAKLGLICAELADVTGRLQVRWGPGGRSEAPSGPRSARVRRG